MMSDDNNTTTKCMYHITAAAELAGEQSTRCANPATYRIAGSGPSASGLVLLSFCEGHYQKVKEYIGQESAEEEDDSDDEQQEEDREGGPY
jgi:hypothetical protein